MPSKNLYSVVRIVLDEVLRTDADFTAFVFDHFTNVHQRLPSGMDRMAKTTLLLQLAGAEAVLGELKCAYPAKVAAIEIKLGFTFTIKSSDSAPNEPAPSAGSGGSEPPLGRPVNRDANNPAGSGGSGPPPPKKPQTTLLLGLLALLIALGFALSQTDKIPLAKTIRQMIDVGLALLSMVVCYALGPTFGVFKNRWGRVSGSGAVFLIVLIVLFAADSHVEFWSVSGEIQGLPEDKIADVRIGSCQSAAVSRGTGLFSLSLNRDCAQKPYELVVKVEDCEDQRERVESLTKYIRVIWKHCAAKVRQLDGHVYQRRNGTTRTPLEGVTIELVGCDDATKIKKIATLKDGSFELTSIVGTCQNPPYHLRYYNDFIPVTDLEPPSQKAHSIDVFVDLPTRTPQLPDLGQGPGRSLRTIPSKPAHSAATETAIPGLPTGAPTAEATLVVMPFRSHPVVVEGAGKVWVPTHKPAIGGAVEAQEYRLPAGSYRVSCAEFQGKPDDWQSVSLNPGQKSTVWCK